MKNGMTAKKLRALLIVLMLLSIIATVGGFLFFQNQLTGYATAISKLNADADSGDQSIQTLRTIESRLSTEQDTITKAKSVVANNATFAEEVVRDISAIAAKSGVTITNFEFNDTAAATTTTPTAPAAAGSASAAAATTIPSGVTKKVMTISIDSPLPYTNLMNFLKNIEGNDLKIQVPSVSITKGEGNLVDTQTFSIEVYVR